MKGTVVAFSERLKDRNGNLIGWLIGGRAPGTIVVRRLGGFDITGAAGLPDGGLLLLERRFRYSEGVKMRIRRIKAADLRRGNLITGEVLLEATDSLQYRQYGRDRGSPCARWRNRHDADVGRQFQRRFSAR